MTNPLVKRVLNLGPNINFLLSRLRMVSLNIKFSICASLGFVVGFALNGNIAISSDSIIHDEALLKILDLPVLVVLDEAYIEFSGIDSRMGWVKKHENLIVLRTFSKRAGTFKSLVYRANN